MPRSRLRSRLAQALPAAWYAPRPTPLSLLLLPLAVVFGAVVAGRRRLYRLGVLASVRVGRPVIVVGNLTAGGAGKTPLVRHLAAALRQRGHRPGVVGRGYGARVQAACLVDAGDTPEKVGDEALLYAADGLPVAVGPDRVAAARTLIGHHPEVDLIIADDGLQHYRLARDVEIVVVDAERGFGNGWLLPAGPLREPARRAGDADALVLNGAALHASLERALGRAGARAGARHAAMRTFTMRLVPQAFRNLAVPERTASATDFAGAQVHAVAGIAHPERFFAMLRGLGLAVDGRAFPDHHAFTREDFAEFRDAVLMTEKDAVKCRAFADQRFWSVPVSADVEPPLAPFVEEKLRGPQAA